MIRKSKRKCYTRFFFIRIRFIRNWYQKCQNFKKFLVLSQTTLIELRNCIHMFQRKIFIFLLLMAEVLGGIVCVLVSFCPFTLDSPLITYEQSYRGPADIVSYFLSFNLGPMKIQFKKLLKNFWQQKRCENEETSRTEGRLIVSYKKKACT